MIINKIIIVDIDYYYKHLFLLYFFIVSIFKVLHIINGRLMGIKGQYLFLDTEFVLNVRKFTGYFITIKIND